MFQKLSSIYFSAALLGAFALSACSTTAPRPNSVQSTTIRANQEYRLGSGDELRITVFGHDDLSGEVEVDGTGAVSMALIGQIQVLNLTTSQVEESIAQKLRAGYLNNPKVSAEVVNYRPYYILGEVGNPGQYPYTSGLTVMEAIAAAGGFSYRANKKTVGIKSKDSASEDSVGLDGNTPVLPGDTIRILERFF